MSVTEIDVLRSLIKHNFMTCAQLGYELWQGGRGAGFAPINTRKYSSCSCPYARPAGAMVKRLVKKGLVRRKYVNGDHRTFYEATKLGEEHYEWATRRPIDARARLSGRRSLA